MPTNEPRQDNLARLLSNLIRKVHDFDQLGPANDRRFTEVEQDLRAYSTVLTRPPAPTLDALKINDLLREKGPSGLEEWQIAQIGSLMTSNQHKIMQDTPAAQENAVRVAAKAVDAWLVGSQPLPFTDFKDKYIPGWDTDQAYYFWEAVMGLHDAITLAATPAPTLPDVQ